MYELYREGMKVEDGVSQDESERAETIKGRQKGAADVRVTTPINREEWQESKHQGSNTTDNSSFGRHGVCLDLKVLTYLYRQ